MERRALARADEMFSQRLGEVRSALLEVTLPSITGPASAVDLRDFKRRHGPRLVQFRQEIESRAMGIAEKGGAAAEAALRNAMNGLQGEVDALEWALEDPKGALLRVAAVVGIGAVKTALDTTAAIDEVPNVKRAIEKAFGPASDGSAAGHSAYAAQAE